MLTDEELAAIWWAAGQGDYATIVRLLILTGQRREEIGGMLWSEIDAEGPQWHIGAERTKNGLAHDLPLSGPAMALLSHVDRREGRDLTFGVGRLGAFQGGPRRRTRSKRGCNARDCVRAAAGIPRRNPGGCMISDELLGPTGSPTLASSPT